MIRHFSIGAAALAAATIFACSSSDSTTKPGGSVPTTCNNPVVSSTDGASACEPECTAGQHCSTSGVTCIDGCTTASNCSSGQACDMSAGTHDLEGKSTGVCRVPAPCPVANSSSSSSSSGGNAGTSSVVGCFTSTGASPTSACSTFQSCVLSKCDSQLKAAFGNGYATGSVGGTCQAYYTCLSAQGCSSASEQSCASQATAACQSSLQAVGSCVNGTCGTDQTACNSSITGGGGINFDAGNGDTGSCPKLVTCCQKIADSNTRMECSQQAASNDDFTCQHALTQYVADNDCPSSH